eukprot:6470177-Prymnesium_polylepis.1
MRDWLVRAGRDALVRVPPAERAASVLIDALGGLLYTQGKLEEAAPLYREALEGRRATLGDRHPNTL